MINISDIEKLKYLQIEHGGEAKFITMNKRTYSKIAASIAEVVAFDTKYHPGAKIYGMEIMINNKLEDGVMYITDSYLQGSEDKEDG